MIQIMFGSVNFKDMFAYVLTPELIATLIIAPFLFNKLNNYATKVTL